MIIFIGIIEFMTIRKLALPHLRTSSMRFLCKKKKRKHPLEMIAIFPKKILETDFQNLYVF